MQTQRRSRLKRHDAVKNCPGEVATAAGASRHRVHLELRYLQAQRLFRLSFGKIVIKTDKLSVPDVAQTTVNSIVPVHP